jgi:hypothetical protein
MRTGQLIGWSLCLFLAIASSACADCAAAITAHARPEPKEAE